MYNKHSFLSVVALVFRPRCTRERWHIFTLFQWLHR